MKRMTFILLTICMLLAAGCAEEKSGSGGSTGAPPIIDPGNGPFVPPGNGPGSGPGDNWEYGGTAALELHSVDRLIEYTLQARNNPTDVRINVNLTSFGSSRYGGTVSISYKDGGVYYEGNFTSGSSADSNKYNVWFTKNGKTGYHGFFEDYLGAIIIVIDDFIDLGDGQGVQDTVNGSVYFKNFGYTYAPHPPTYCWFVSLGPYDCRAWKSGDGIDTKKALHPDSGSGYKKLGDFTGLSIKEAFNEEFEL